MNNDDALRAAKAEIARLRKWKAEAAEVFMGWEAAWQALPEPVREAGLGRLKADVVVDYIVQMRDAA